MERLASGDRSALGPLVERHYTRVYRIALSYLKDPDDALDAVQEVFVKLCEKAGSWQATTRLEPWLCRLAVNHAIDRYRRRRYRRKHSEPLDDDLQPERHASTDPSPERMAHARQLGERISQALEALPERQRAIFVLRHQEELSLHEIAEALEMNLGTVKSSLHRAIARLRPLLQGTR